MTHHQPRDTGEDMGAQQADGREIYSVNGMESGAALCTASPQTQDRPSHVRGRSYAPAVDGAGFEPSPRCHTKDQSDDH